MRALLDIPNERFKMNTRAKYITEVSVLDPDSQHTIQVAIYKDLASGAMFGLDSSFVEQVDPDTIPSPFNKDGTLTLL
jgi:hypothetical protein